MNRLTYNLIFWPCFIFGANFAHATVNSPNATNSSVLLALCIVCFVVSGIRIKTLGRSLWNLLWLCIPGGYVYLSPVVSMHYSLVSRIRGYNSIFIREVNEKNRNSTKNGRNSIWIIDLYQNVNRNILWIQ